MTNFRRSHSALPSISLKQLTSLVLLLLVTSTTLADVFDCPSGCVCDESTLSARCEQLDGLIASYSQKPHKSRDNFMPIKSLDLSNNKLTKLTNQLELLVNLTELNLSHNQLTQVHKLNFEQLDKLDLSHNQITSAKLKKLPKNVAHLNLAHNEITYLPVDFMKLKKLRSLELTGNPLNCTCNTLHVRNWLTFNHVWSDKIILCSSPAIVKGQPWLQARQNDICMMPSTTTQRSAYNWDNYDDNEIMMGDQPAADDVNYDDEEEEQQEEQEETDSTDVFADEDKTEKPDEKQPEEEEDKAEDNEAIDDDLMPVSQEPEVTSKAPTIVVDKSEENYDEGSGDDAPPVSPQTVDDGDESGSGGIIPPGDFESSTDEPVERETVASLGIFEDNTEVPIGVQSVINDATVDAGSQGEQKGDLKTASTEDNTGTYVLLGILGLCLISLMLFVAMKNRKEKNRNRRYDVEKNGATELQDMDKRLLGKPIDRNGNGNGKAEQAPLMNGDDKPTAFTSFHPTPAISIDEPKAAPRENNKSQQSLYDNPTLTNGNGHVEPVHGKSPDSDDEIFHPAESLNVAQEVPKRYSPIYTPASPRSERYSPVYSPETGRVKIKLTETPKPKTPVVVTRSRSRAGDYVNTPN